MTEDSFPGTATLIGLLVKHENQSGMVYQGIHYKFFLYLILSSIVHAGLFFALAFDGLKSAESGSRIVDQSSNTLLATINIQPSLSHYPATAKPKGNTLAATARNQPNSKISPSRTNGTSTILMRYFKGEELTLQPKLRGNIALDNPESTTMPEAGTVQLRLLLNAKGSVDKVIIDNTSLPETFVESVKYSFLTATFEPGEIDGLPVQSQFIVEIRYEASLPK